MRVDELDYDLPAQLIAQEPCARREDARMLLVPRQGIAQRSYRVEDLPGLVRPALFVLNDTKVLPARIVGTRPTGGRFELLLVERISGAGTEERWLSMGRPLKNLKPGMRLVLDGIEIEIGPRHSEPLIEVVLRAAGGVLAALDRVGHMPLPPYIARKDDARDAERYQTVFAREPGAVAAPTASLHFSAPLLADLAAHGHERAFVTLHVGPGTFMPLSVEELAQHPMHEERFHVPQATIDAITAAKAEGRPVIAVGTTVARTLESAARDGWAAAREGWGRTRLCVYPPYEFRVVDGMLTNFHLPRSTLLALVMAFAGIETTRAAYRAAVAGNFRFFSYGDAMLALRPSDIRPGMAGERELG